MVESKGSGFLCVLFLEALVYSKFHDDAQVHLVYWSFNHCSVLFCLYILRCSGGKSPGILNNENLTRRGLSLKPPVCVDSQLRNLRFHALLLGSFHLAFSNTDILQELLRTACNERNASKSRPFPAAAGAGFGALVSLPK